MFSLCSDTKTSDKINKQILLISKRKFLNPQRNNEGFVEFFIRLLKCGTDLKILDEKYYIDNAQLIYECLEIAKK